MPKSVAAVNAASAPLSGVRPPSQYSPAPVRIDQPISVPSGDLWQMLLPNVRSTNIRPAV